MPKDFFTKKTPILSLETLGNKSSNLATTPTFSKQHTLDNPSPVEFLPVEFGSFAQRIAAEKPALEIPSRSNTPSLPF
jgi:hypothetical protein